MGIVSFDVSWEQNDAMKADGKSASNVDPQSEKAFATVE